jgi:hypothetical protein
MECSARNYSRRFAWKIGNKKWHVRLFIYVCLWQIRLPGFLNSHAISGKIRETVERNSAYL